MKISNNNKYIIYQVFYIYFVCLIFFKDNNIVLMVFDGIRKYYEPDIGGCSGPDPPSPLSPDKKGVLPLIKGIELTQYTRPKLTNPYDKPLEILAYGKTIATIPVGGSSVLTINGESNIKFKVGENFDVVPTKVNLAPKISIERIAPMGEDASVRDLQNRVGYRITITDDILANIDINISGGGVEVNKVANNIYDVTLKMFPNKKAFDAWSLGKTSPYKVVFDIDVKDKYNPNHKINKVEIFSFGKW